MSTLPLDGIRIIDMGHVFALPYAGGLMADLGAEVIKVEGPNRIDTTRVGNLGGGQPDNQPGEDPWNRSSTYNIVNRGKKSIVLDLSKQEGLKILKELIVVSDIVMENFTPRVMRRWKLDYQSMKNLKPDIIMISNTGYGHGRGPYSEYPAQATSQEATHGLTHITGYNQGIPSKAGQSFVDFLACWTCMLAAALALRHRQRTGRGQWIDLGMYQLGCYTTGEYILDWQANRRLGDRIGNRHPWRAPQGCYPCTGVDQWCVLSVGDDEEWEGLCQALGRTNLLNDPRLSSRSGRLTHHDEIDSVISSWSRTRDKFHVMEILQSHGVPSGPVFDSKDSNLSHHYWTRDFLEKIDFPSDRNIGQRVVMGRPWRMSRTQLKIAGPAPKLGQHNREILKDVLGYSKKQYIALEEANIIAARPRIPQEPPAMTLEDMVKLGRLSYVDKDFKKHLGT